MSSPSKIRGTRWESAVRDYLVSRGFSGVERRSLNGNKDRGDLLGVDGWTFEAKDEARISLAGYVDEARVEAANAGTPWFAAIVKRRRKSTADAYVVLPLGLFTSLLAAQTVLEGHRKP